MIIYKSIKISIIYKFILSKLNLKTGQVTAFLYFRMLFRLSFVALLLLKFSLIDAQTFVPVNVSGFNHDLIANGSGGTNRAAATTTITFDGVNIGGDNVMYSKDFRGNNNPTTAPTYGLPTNRIINSINLIGANYQLANYDSSNALVLKTNGSSGSLKLETPGVFSKIAFLGSSAEGASTFNVILNFSDGTNTSAPFSVPDWFDGTGFAIKGIGRVTRTQVQTQGPDQFTGTSENPRLYDNQISLNAPFNTKILTSITFTKTSAGGSTAILAINGITPVNAPAAPVAISATNINAPNFTANWRSVSGATTYYIDVSTSPTFSSLVANYNNRSVGNVQTLNITGLPFYPIYYYRVRAANAGGISASSNTIDVIVQQCPIGNVLVSTQSQIDSFKIQYPYCTKITGLLNITNGNDIFNVNGFNKIDTITDQLNIINNSILNNLDGFKNLKFVGSNFWIAGNGILSSVKSFDSLVNVGHLYIGANPKLTEISGFYKVKIFPLMTIENNSELVKLDCFSSLNVINSQLTFKANPKLLDIQSLGGVKTVNGFLNIENNTKLSTLTAFRLTTFIKDLNIVSNPSLFTLNDLSAVTNVDGKIQIQSNSSINNISGLKNINPATIKGTGLIITNNTSLSVCNLPNFCTYLQGAGARSISGNLGNCVTEQAVINACNALAAPVALAATSITSSGFTANWQATSGSTKYLLDVSTSSTFTTFVTGYNNRDVGNVLTFGITGLSTSTIYYYRVRANNASSTSPNSNVIQLTTLAAGLTAPVALAATSITSTAFTANWQASSGATKYLLDVSTSSTFNTFVTGYNNLDVGNVLTRNITGLNANTMYYFRVRANNTSSTSTNSNVIQLTTLAAGLTAPVALAATNISSFGFTANWQASSGATKYLLDVSTSSTFNTFVTGYNNLDVGNVLTQNITGLTANTLYHYRVRANNTSSISSNSNVILLTTLDNSIVPKPVSVSGFTYDIIANGSGGTNRALATTTNDLGTFVLYSKDFRGNNNQSTAPIYGLPDNGKITNASLSGYDYQLANYNGNNALVLKNLNDTGTLRLNAQDTFTHISILAFSENGVSAVTAIAYFSDGTNTTLKFDVLDWFGQPNFAIKGIGRISKSNDQFDPGETDENPRMYNHEFALSTPFDNKKLVSITFTKTSTSGGLAILAITGLGRGKNPSCNITIPDANFKSYLLSNSSINTNGDSEIQCAEADAFTGFMNCPLKNISDLTGIEKFINITKLDCSNNNLTKLDLSKNTKLNEILCGVNKLTSLNVTSCSALKELYCGATNLSALDVSNNTDLTKLQCHNSFITKLNVSKNIMLERLECQDNELLSLDISKNTSLIELNCSMNTLGSLNLANGINQDMTSIVALFNPDLTCIKVDNADYSNNNWRKAPFQFDAQHEFNEECDACDEWREKLNSNFLISANACIGDTMHLIDYSNLELENDITFTWDFGNGATSIERDPEVIYNAPGKYTISLIVSNLSCQSLIIQKDISILSCLNNSKNNQKLAMIFPTPNTGEPKIFVKLIEKSPILLKIFDSNGRLIKSYSYDETQLLTEHITIDYPGVYWLEFIHRNGIEKLKTFVIK